MQIHRSGASRNSLLRTGGASSLLSSVRELLGFQCGILAVRHMKTMARRLILLHMTWLVCQSQRSGKLQSPLLCNCLHHGPSLLGSPRLGLGHEKLPDGHTTKPPALTKMRVAPRNRSDLKNISCCRGRRPGITWVAPNPRSSSMRILLRMHQVHRAPAPPWYSSWALFDNALSGNTCDFASYDMTCNVFTTHKSR